MKWISPGFVLLGCFLCLGEGCISPGPHLFLSREETAISPVPPIPPPTEPGLIPPLSGSHQLVGSLGQVNFSGDVYRGTGGSSFIFGGESRGDRYRMFSPSLSLGAQSLAGEKGGQE